MIRLAILAVTAASLAGCAREPTQGMSYVGLSDVEAAEAPESDAELAAMPSAVRHIQSNKVLGAMAFQKVTGQTVDPSRLSGN